MMGSIFWASYLLLWGAVLTLGTITFSILRAISSGMLKKNEPTSHTLPGPELGSLVPSFQLIEAVTGRQWTRETLLGKPTYLFFFHPHCSGCHAVIPAVNEFLKSQPGAQAIVVSRADRIENVEFAKQHSLEAPVLVDKNGETSLALQVNHTPYAVLLDAEGKVHNKFPMMSTTIADLIGFVQTLSSRGVA